MWATDDRPLPRSQRPARLQLHPPDLIWTQVIAFTTHLYNEEHTTKTGAFTRCVAVCGTWLAAPGGSQHIRHHPCFTRLHTPHCHPILHNSVFVVFAAATVHHGTGTDSAVWTRPRTHANPSSGSTTLHNTFIYVCPMLILEVLLYLHTSV